MPEGIPSVDGSFVAGDAVEILGPLDRVVAKGLARVDAATMRTAAGHRTTDLDGDAAGVMVHRDDLVVLAESA